ncbi:MAG: HPP family protein [Thermaerobacter sp.]|nr:HPP family protein [Thermaerobacter sp.]
MPSAPVRTGQVSHLWSGYIWFVLMLALVALPDGQPGVLRVLLVPPFAATLSIVLRLSEQDVAQPLPVVLGSTLGAAIGTVFSFSVHGPVWAVVAAVATFVLLNALRTYHPPALALSMYPLLLRPSVLFPLIPVAAFTLVAVGSAAVLSRRVAGWPTYPRRPAKTNDRLGNANVNGGQ